jgi:ABC-2 type transport system ATP-binding protein
MYAIETKNITKVYAGRKSKFKALDRVNLKVKEGQIFGLLGPNGAGKTTLINILSTLLLPTSGSASVLGFNIIEQPEEIRQRIGVCYGSSRFYWNLNARESLNYYGMIHGMNSKRRKEKIEELAEALDMKHFMKIQFSFLSTGMRQKIAIAKAFLNDPQMIFLDEPTIGLDVDVARKVRRFLKNEAKEKGVTILLTSHNMYEVELMCKEIALINKGRIIRKGEVEDIKNNVRFPDTIRLRLDRYDKLDFIRSMSGVKKMRVAESGAAIVVDSAKDVVDNILSELRRRGVKVLDLEIRKASLEDVFMKIVSDSNV